MSQETLVLHPAFHHRPFPWGKSQVLRPQLEDPKWGELKPEAAFNHTKHSTDVTHSIDGTTVTACVECHHTDQSSARKAEEYLKRFERKELLTAAQLETSKQPVKSCRACHLSPSSEETDEFPPKGVKYPKKTGRPPSGKLTNDVAYHINCLFCHDAAKTRDPKLKAPQESPNVILNSRLLRHTPVFQSTHPRLEGEVASKFDLQAARRPIQTGAWL